MNLTRIRQQTLASITQRYDAHASRTLRDFLCAPETFEWVDPQQMAFIWGNRRELLRDFAQPDTLTFLSNACINSTLRYTYARNQFLNFPDAYLSLLAQVYQTFFVHLRDNLHTATSQDKLFVEFRDAVRQHHARLRKMFAVYCQAIHPAAPAEHPLLESVCCEEYSAPFQLRLLHVDFDTLREPILDIGCGSKGEVVTYLKQMGYAAVGIDRLAPLQPGYVRADWFAFDFQENAWGTILAHQSFSTHFLHGHLHTPRLAAPYAKLYLAILNSLRPGGTFYYTPGLPFFESHVQSLSEYHLQKIPMERANIPESIRPISYVVMVKKHDHPAKHHPYC